MKDLTMTIWHGLLMVALFGLMGGFVVKAVVGAERSTNVKRPHRYRPIHGWRDG
jgi:hypothetical protein